MSADPLPVPPRARRREPSGSIKPDFFIVGHPKCGTTALYQMLRAHPQIYMPSLKEPQFLAREPGERAATGKHPDTLESYLALFSDARPDQCVGEASTTYLRSPTAPARIAALRPDARIIAVFREPASFLVSLHLQLLESGIETEPDFARAIALEPHRKHEADQLPADRLWAQMLLYGEYVRYTAQLRRYHEQFGRERVLALIYEDLRRENDRVVRQVLRFLGVDDSLALERVRANPTVRIRFPGAQNALNALALGSGPLARRLGPALKATTPTPLRRAAVRALRRPVIDRSPRPPDPRLIAQLQRRFEGEVDELGEYMQRDLRHLWGYEEAR